MADSLGNCTPFHAELPAIPTKTTAARIVKVPSAAPGAARSTEQQEQVATLIEELGLAKLIQLAGKIASDFPTRGGNKRLRS